MSAGVALLVGWADLSIWMATWSSHGILLSFLFTERVTAQLDAMGVVDDAVEDRVGKGWIAEHLWMPQRLTDESLGCGWLIPTTPYLASAFRSATDARDEDRG
jgi:hypothetical protein